MDYKASIGKYLEKDKIIDVVLSKEKTTKGKDVLEIEIEGGKIKSLPAEMLSLLESSEPKDATTNRDIVAKLVTSEIISILLERYVKIEDIDYFFLRLNESINLTLKMANDKLWGKDSFERTIADVDKILTNKKLYDGNKKGRTKTEDSTKTKK